MNIIESLMSRYSVHLDQKLEKCLQGPCREVQRGRRDRKDLRAEILSEGGSLQCHRVGLWPRVARYSNLFLKGGQ